MLKQARDPPSPYKELLSPDLPSLPPTPPPKDYFPVAASNAGGPGRSPLADGSNDLFSASLLSLNHRSGPLLSPNAGGESTLELSQPARRPTLKRTGQAFAASTPAPPTLTITQITTSTSTLLSSPPRLDGASTSNEHNYGSTRTRRSVSGSGGKSGKKLPRRPSIPNSFVSSSAADHDVDTVDGYSDGHAATDADGSSDARLTRGMFSTTASPVSFVDLREIGASSGASRAAQRCLHALLELVETESVYVADLAALNRYTEYLARSAQSLLDNAQSSTISRLNVDEMLQLHTPIRDHLNSVRRNLEGSSHQLDDAKIVGALGNVVAPFLSFDGQREAYEKFCVGYGEVLDVIRPLQHTPDYLVFEQKASMLLRESRPELTEVPSANASSTEHLDERQPNGSAASLNSPAQSTFNPSELGVAGPSKGRLATRTSITSRTSLRSLRRSLGGGKSSSIISTSPAPSAPTSHAPSPVPSSEHLNPHVHPHHSSHSSLRSNSSDAHASLNPSTIPPVPPIPASYASSMIPPPLPMAYPLQAPASKPLAFRDLLIKPIQRVCRYPLLLAQLRVPASVLASARVDSDDEGGDEGGREGERLERAIGAMKAVAKKVDEAQEMIEVAAKSAMIVERIDPHSVRLFSSTKHFEILTLSPLPLRSFVLLQSVDETFIRQLGPCVLASALDVVDSHPGDAPPASNTSIKVKYVAAFLYRGYFLLAKVRKNGRLRLWHWFPTEGCVLSGEERSHDHAPRTTFLLEYRTHSFELTASCRDEASIWSNALRRAINESYSGTRSLRSSLELLDDALAASGQPVTPKRRQSFFFPAGPSAPAMTVTARQSAPPPETATSNPTVLDAPSASSTSVTKTPATIKRLSTASLASLFASDQATSPVSAPRRRTTPSPSNRQLVDRSIREVMSEVCLSARAQAQINGELFASANPPTPRRSRTLSFVPGGGGGDAEVGDLEATPTKNRRKTQRQSIDPASFSSASQQRTLARMSEESQNQHSPPRNESSAAAAGRRRSTSSPTAHRRAKSLPGITAPLSASSASASHRPVPSAGRSDPIPNHLGMTRLSYDVTKPLHRTVFDLADEAVNSSRSKDESEEDVDEYTESGWDRDGDQDDTTSAAHTDFSSVDAHPRPPYPKTIMLFPPQGAAPTSQRPVIAVSPDEDLTPSSNDEVTVSYVGKGITNSAPTAPTRQRSLFRKSFLSLSRRRTRSSPSPSPSAATSDSAHTASPTSESHSSHRNNDRDQALDEEARSESRPRGQQLLSPSWISSSRRSRSRSRSPASEPGHGESSSSSRHRNAIDLSRDD